MRIPSHHPPPHPGEMLEEEFLKPLGMSQSELARRLGISFPRVNELIRGKRGVSPDTALRLACLFGTTPDVWLSLQLMWDLYHISRSRDAKRIKQEVQPVNYAKAS